KQHTMSAMSTAHTRYASGAAGPSPAAAATGSTKIPAPIVVLMMLAVSCRVPIARTSPASVVVAMPRDFTSSSPGGQTPAETPGQTRAFQTGAQRLRKQASDSLPRRPQMALASLKDLYFDELGDLFDAEMQMIRTLPRLAEAARAPELREALKKHCDESRLHLERLELIFTHWGERRRIKPCAGLAGIVQEADERLNQEATDDVRDAS